jgi:hypothetical protein
MTERAPQPDSEESPDGYVQPEASVSELHIQRELEQVGPATAAFYAHCELNSAYPNASPMVQTRMRPHLAFEFIRSAVQRAAERRALVDPYDTKYRLYFDEQSLNRKINNVQSYYGIKPSTDTVKNEKRNNYLQKKIKVAMGNQHFAEIGATVQFYEEVIDTTDEQTQDSLAVLLAAFGSTLEPDVYRR